MKSIALLWIQLPEHVSMLQYYRTSGQMVPQTISTSIFNFGQSCTRRCSILALNYRAAIPQMEDIIGHHLFQTTCQLFLLDLF